MIDLKKKNPLTQPIGRTRNVVGLDIEAGSIAATEVQVNGAVTRRRLRRRAAGRRRRSRRRGPRSRRARRTRSRSCSPSQSFPRDVRIGIANQRVVVRTHAAAADRRRRRARDRDPLRGPGPHPDAARPGGPRLAGDPAARPATRQQGSRSSRSPPAARCSPALIEAVDGAGLRLVGIDHSAFALIRALRGRERRAGRTTRDPTEADAEGEAPPVAGGRLYCHLGDITNLAVARETYCVFSRVLGFGDRGHRPVARRRAAASTSSTRASGSSTSASRPRSRQIEGDPQIVAFTREVLASGTATLVDELRRSLEYYAALEDAVRVDDVVVAGPGTTIPGLVDAAAARAARAARAPPCPQALCERRRPRRRPPDPLLRPRARGVGVRPVNLIPPEDRRGDHAPLRAGVASYAIVARARAWRWSASSLVVLAGNDDQRERERDRGARGAQGAGRRAAASSRPTASSPRSSRPHRRPSAAWPQSRFDWERVLNELALVIPRGVSLESLTGDRRARASSARPSGGASTAADPSITGPSLQIVGCATGQEGVAGFIAALKDIDGVTRVGMQSSAARRAGRRRPAGAAAAPASGVRRRLSDAASPSQRSRSRSPSTRSRCPSTARPAAPTTPARPRRRPAATHDHRGRRRRRRDRDRAAGARRTPPTEQSRRQARVADDRGGGQLMKSSDRMILIGVAVVGLRRGLLVPDPRAEARGGRGPRGRR